MSLHSIFGDTVVIISSFFILKIMEACIVCCGTERKLIQVTEGGKRLLIEYSKLTG